jgi:hypothetical protein
MMPGHHKTIHLTGIMPMSAPMDAANIAVPNVRVMGGKSAYHDCTLKPTCVTAAQSEALSSWLAVSIDIHALLPKDC